MKRATIFLSVGLATGATALATAGGIFIVSYLTNETVPAVSAYSHTTSLKEILKATIKKQHADLQPSAFVGISGSPEEFFDFQFEPNVKMEYLKRKYNLNFQIIPSSIDNFAGTLQLRINGFDKNAQKDDEQRIITVSGFPKAENLSATESLWFTNEINKIQELKLKNGVTSLKTDNFWDSIELPEAIEVFNGIHIPKDAKNKQRFEYSVKVEGYKQDGYFVKLSLGYKSNQTKKITKLFLVNGEFNPPHWKQKLDPEFVKFVLPGNVNQMSLDQLRKTFFADPEDMSSIEIYKTMSNNNDGYIYLKRNSDDGIITFAKYKIASYSTIFDEIYNDKDEKIKNFINNELNVVNNKESVFAQYNASDGFNFRYSRLTAFVNNKLQTRRDYLEKTLKLADSMEIYDFANFKQTANDGGVLVDVVNVSGEAHTIYLPYASKEPRQNLEFNTLGLPIKSIKELEEEIQKRTMAISFFEKKLEDGQQKDYVISGTAWILDKSKTEKNTYFLATNSHVVEKMQANWKNIEVFQYSLYNNVSDLNERDLNIFGKVASKDLRRGIPTNYEGVNTFPEAQKQKYRDLWKTFDIYNLGKDVFGENASADIAIIKIRFPEDDFDKNGVLVKKYTPDAVHYYNEMQEKNETKLKFFTNNNIEWNSDSTWKMNVNETNIKETVLPMDLTLGGFLGGNKWTTNSGSGYLYYSNINKNTEIPFYDNFQDPVRDPILTKSYRSPFQIIIPMSRAGKGMSGSMVLDRFGRVVGIFWGGSFGDQEKADNTIEKGTANLEPLGLSINGNKSIINRWLDITQDQLTDLDDMADEISK